MVGSEVDQKYLGLYAKSTATLNVTLSAGLYKLLGLSTLLARKLLRARKQRKLDPTRTTKSLDLYRHIIWMSREGLSILAHDINPELAIYKSSKYAALNELRVLATKLHASFLHIFVLFDYTYQTKTTMMPTFSKTPNGMPQVHGLVGSHINSSYAYIAPTIDAFNKADDIAKRLLHAAHPLRLSVRCEYSAFTYDCIKDYEMSRRIAKRAMDEAYAWMDKMDDESFQDAMTIVGSLGVMAKRGLSPQPPSVSSSSTNNGFTNSGRTK
ncbi:hypothetical protein RUND412_001851 [Rhizina undulata]